MASSTAELNCLYNVIKRHYNSQESLKLEEQHIRLSGHEMEKVRGIKSCTTAFKRELWKRFRTLLVRQLKENEVKLIQELKEPKSAGDWNVVDYLVKYVSTPLEERINLPVPPAYLVKPASKGLNMAKTWCLERLTACGRFCGILFNVLLMIWISKGASRIWPGPSDTRGSDHTDNSPAKPDTPPTSTDNKDMRSTKNDDISVQVAAKGLKMLLESSLGV
ncbi:PREDICTED: uncharacterized protein LOC103340637 [Prunus mume]|uniref:Uncharacterized protein LOC103340637 n=1 Tax=Prunus mume TaxID=102107 RepID=A0ABM0PNW3_PRUMU|nr:PREDICTED: uncharacterized protein LOC103340637 [Prunus mume]